MTEDIKITHTVLKKFVSDFFKEIEDYKKLFKEDLGLSINDYMPNILTHDNLSVHVTYSKKTKHIFMRFDKRNERSFRSKEVEGQVFDIFDPDKTWGRTSAVRISGSYSNFTNMNTSGVRPFMIEGDDIELSIKDLIVETGGYGKVHIDYGFVFSFKNFIKINYDIRGFLSRYMGVIKEFKKQNTSPSDYKKYLEALKKRMEMIFFDDTVPELEIDKFIELNPIILELGLNITEIKSQVVLKNILNLYEHDLKPDLIAYDKRARNWVIVDYKKAKKTVLKNVGKVRTGFRSDVYSLKDQLRDYVRYFREREQRVEFHNKYGFEIKRPRAIGIIGNVKAEEMDDFEDLIMEEFNNQFNVIPYNYLYENFCDAVDYAFKFVK